MTVPMERPGIPTADASAIATQIYGLLNEVRHLEKMYPHISDYRLEDMREGLTAAFKGADHLTRREHYAEWHTVMMAYPSQYPPPGSLNA